MLQRVVARAEHAVHVDLPNYQVVGEVKKEVAAIIAELEQAAEKVAATEVEKLEPEIQTLEEKIAALKSNAKLAELAKEVGFDVPADVTKFTDRVDAFLAWAKEKAAEGTTPPETVEPVELTEEQKTKVAELVAAGKTEAEAEAEVRQAPPTE